MRNFSRLASKAGRYAIASVAYTRLHPGNYHREYSTDIDEQLKNLETKCPQGDKCLVMQRKQEFKSRYDAYGDRQSVFLARSNEDEMIVGVGSSMITQYVIGEHENETNEYTEAYWLDLRVDPQHRRKGIASNLAKLSFDWAKNKEGANIVAFNLMSTNDATHKLHRKRLDAQNTAYFVHAFNIYAVSLSEKELEHHYTVCVETICDTNKQEVFLNENMPKHYVLYPNKTSLHNLIHSAPFSGVYVARLIDATGEYVNDEWITISVYDQSAILQYSFSDEVLQPLILSANMSTVKDKDNERYMLQELFRKIQKDHEGKMCVLFASTEYERNEVYGDFLEKLDEGNEYYVNLDENTEIHTKVVETISNSGSKELWLDPRKF